MPRNLDAATLQAALVGYRQQLDYIETRIAEIKQKLGKSGSVPALHPVARLAPVRRKHRISAEGRARIAAAQRARWAKAQKKQ
ncbi:MAG: hypothetical protein KGN36_04630 [Acidobacteriota bacterium]|nr:hypothetical protein [Acidobacteriota bacterium]